MREQFEKLPEIAKMIESGDVWWSEKHNNYSGSDSELDCYVDGAWYAFQEQQKKLQHIYDDCTEYTTVSELLYSIRDLLK